MPRSSAVCDQVAVSRQQFRVATVRLVPANEIARVGGQLAFGLSIIVHLGIDLAASHRNDVPNEIAIASLIAIDVHEADECEANFATGLPRWREISDRQARWGQPYSRRRCVLPPRCWSIIRVISIIPLRSSIFRFEASSSVGFPATGSRSNVHGIVVVDAERGLASQAVCHAEIDPHRAGCLVHPGDTTIRCFEGFIAKLGDRLFLVRDRVILDLQSRPRAL